MAKTGPRLVPSKDEKYMGLAIEISSFSKDPNTQMGALIISDKNEPLAWGYNGPPRKFKDDDLDWSRPAKYNVILHAEQNAFINRIGKVTGGIMYVTGKPCKMCMLEIAGYELREVIYFPFKSGDRNSNFFSKDDEVVDELAKLGNVTLRKFEGNLSWKRDRIKLLENIGIFG